MLAGLVFAGLIAASTDGSRSALSIGRQSSGAGSSTHMAVALKHGASRVEIDFRSQQIGARDHSSRSCDDPRGTRIIRAQPVLARRRARSGGRQLQGTGHRVPAALNQCLVAIYDPRSRVWTLQVHDNLGAAPRARAVRVAGLVTAVLLAIAAIEVVLVARAVQGGWYGPFAVDFDLYTDYARSWLRGDGFYLPIQLQGTYVVEDTWANVYPPVLLYLVVPFTLLPAVLWWAVPLGIIGITLYRVKPAWWAYPLLAFVLCYPRVWTILVTGNPAMWSIAFAVAGVAFGWPAVGAALKITFAPLALIGINRRSWWAASGFGILLCIPFGSMWLDYLTVMLNAESSRGFGYIAGEWPIALGLVAVAASGHAGKQSMYHK